MLVVHPHFHARRTGVTAHTELIVEALQPYVEAFASGDALDAKVPRITLREVLRRAKTDDVIWHAHRNNEVLVGLLLKLLRRKIHVVLTHHGPKAAGRWTRFLFKLVERLVTLNTALASSAGVPSRIVQHGVSTDRFRPPPDRTLAFQSLAIPGMQGIGVIGRIRPEKGQGDFVSAIAPLLSTYTQWTPVLVGLAKPEDEAWAKGLVEQTKGRLVLAGEKNDTAPWYQGLSIVVHPSYFEAFSMVLIEAMASGCCVVATKIAAVPEVITDGETGFLYEPGDVDHLRTILDKLMADPQLVQRVGIAAAHAARERHSVKHEVGELLSVYSSLTDNSTPFGSLGA